MNVDTRTSYGVFNFRPAFLQPLNKISLFAVCISLSGLLQGALTNGFLPSSFTAIETRFGVSSFEVSVMPALFEFSSLLPLLPISYIGGRSSQPRILALGLFVQVLGTSVLLVPHYMTKDEPSVMAHLVAQADDLEVGYCAPEFEIESAKDLHDWIYVFYTGCVIMGFGNAALWANSFDYLDKNLSDEDFIIYNAIFSMTAVWGPGLGYVIGWLVLRLPFDDVKKSSDRYNSLTEEQLENLQSSPLYIGAYWLGILIIAIIQFVVIIPLIGFPREFPNSAEIRKGKEVPVSYGSIESKSIVTAPEEMTFNDVRSGFGHLFTNPLYVSLIIASTSSAFFVVSLAMFGPQLSQVLFSVSSKEAALLCACIVFPTSIMAVIVGGLIPKIFKFSIKDLFLSCLVGSFITFVLGFALLFPCDKKNDINVSRVYDYRGTTCNVTDCNCDPYVFKPYCVDHQVSLYNPCFYGCIDDDITHCSCYDETINTVLEPGDCSDESNCGKVLFVVFGTVLSLMCFIAFFVFPSTTTAIDRVVLPQYRSFGFGVALFILRLFGTTPAPLLTGVIFDQSCDFKPETDDAIRSSCVSYSSLNQSFAIVAICCCGFSALVLSFGYLNLRIRGSENDDQERQFLVGEKVSDVGKLLEEILQG